MDDVDEVDEVDQVLVDIVHIVHIVHTTRADGPLSNKAMGDVLTNAFQSVLIRIPRLSLAFQEAT